jgi:CO/xanthine dehydrogenase Mo-binding subunit
LDTWLSFDAEGAITAYFGKMDMGQGVDTAIAQVVAEELDVDVARVAVVMGDTQRTPNQGGASGSSGCRLGANALRNAAAEASACCRAASERLACRPSGSEWATAPYVGADPRRPAAEAGPSSLRRPHPRRLRNRVDWNGQYGTP